MYCTEIAGFFNIARAEQNLWFIKFKKHSPTAMDLVWIQMQTVKTL